jgi:excisionase family DNA binding protein
MTTTTEQRHEASRDIAGSPTGAPLLSIDDVATYLGVSTRWVYSQVRSGRLPAMLIARSWRLRREAVDEFAESFRVDGTDAAE